MGSKVGYASAILGAMGLSPGQGAQGALIVDPGPWADAWRVLIDPEATGELLDLFKQWEAEDRDPKEFWEALKAEFVEDPKSGGPIHAAARWIHLCGNSYMAGNINTGVVHHSKTETDPRVNNVRIRFEELLTRIRALRRLPWPDTEVLQKSAYSIYPADLGLEDAEGCVIYMDPPYENTTGYLHDFTRKQVIEVAQRWDAAGATVCISEGVPIEIKGFNYKVQIEHARRGTRRTMSKSKDEWLTLNRVPARVAPRPLSWIPGAR